MAAAGRIRRFFCGRDWRIWFGLIVTIVWIAGGTWYVLAASGGDVGSLSLDAVGNFLEGAFAPLAFLWLVLGLFIQQRELARNTEAIRRTSEQSEKQTLAIAATEMNARQETFFTIADGVKKQLGGISGMLFISGLGPVGSQRYSREQTDDMFSRAARDDAEIFARQFISQDYEEEGGLAELLYGTKIRQRHSRNFQRVFERLLKLSENCDVDGIIRDSLTQSAFGLLYDRMRRLDPNQAADASAAEPR